MTRNVFPAERRRYLSATCSKPADVNVYKSMKAYAETSGKTLAQVILEACRQYLEDK